MHLADWLSCALLGNFLRRFSTGPARAEAARCACLVGVVCLERWSAEGQATGMNWTLEDLLELAAGLVSGVDISGVGLGTSAGSQIKRQTSYAAQARQALEGSHRSLNGHSIAEQPQPSLPEDQCGGSRGEVDVPVYVPDSPPQDRICIAHPGSAAPPAFWEMQQPATTPRILSPAASPRVSPTLRSRAVAGQHSGHHVAEPRPTSVGSRSEDDLSRSRGATPRHRGFEATQTPSMKPVGRAMRPATGAKAVPVMEAAQLTHRAAAASSIAGRPQHVALRGVSGGSAVLPGGGNIPALGRGRGTDSRSNSEDSLRGGVRRPARSAPGSAAPSPRERQQPIGGKAGVPDATHRRPSPNLGAARVLEVGAADGVAGNSSAASHATVSPGGGRRSIGCGAVVPRISSGNPQSCGASVPRVASSNVRLRHTLR